MKKEKVIKLKSTGFHWVADCSVSKKLKREIYILDIFKWQDQGYKIIVVNGVFK